MLHVNLENARSKEQEAVMSKIIDDGVCPFCSQHLEKYHKEPILKEGTYWIITRNQWPYKGAKNHLLAISKLHINTLDELPPEAGAELISLFQDMWRELKIVGGTIAMRMGNDDRYASSVRHLHAHLIEPDFESSTYPEEGIEFRVSKKAK